MLRLSKNIGPGFLLAGAAVGVSHLVQSTRAGAEYGWVLILALVLACVSKYPFLKMGPLYTAATGKNLIEGYKMLGKFQYYTYIFISLGSMFIAMAAITLVTGGIVSFLIPAEVSILSWCSLVLLICVLLLLLGRFKALDKTMKVIISLLTVITCLAVAVAVLNFETHQNHIEIPSLTTSSSIAFIVAFMGWMPIPIDASVWHSIWTKEKSDQTGKPTSLRDVGLDFNLGYIGSSVIGVLFFLLGVLVMFGSGIEFSNSGVAFSGQLIDLYAQTLGQWTKPIIGFAAFITLFSTTLTVADAFPRVFSEISLVEGHSKKTAFKVYVFTLLLLAVISLGIIQFGTSQFKLLVDFATGLSFLSAPFLAWFNYQLFQKKNVPEDFQFKTPFKVFSLLCLAGLVGFNFIYIWSIF